MMSSKDLVSLIAVLANVATIGAVYVAWRALTVWRKQIAGQSSHELAKKLSGALRQVAIVRAETLKDLNWFREVITADDTRAFMVPFARSSLQADTQALTEAVAELQALEGQVAVQWGDTMLNLVEIIRYESWSLGVYAEVTLDDEHRDTPVAQMVLSSPRVTPTFTGGAYAKALDSYTKLAQDWLGMHVGREGAQEMSEADLKAKRERVDDEVKRLAEPERLAAAKATSSSPAGAARPQ